MLNWFLSLCLAFVLGYAIASLPCFLANADTTPVPTVHHSPSLEKDVIAITQVIAQPNIPNALAIVTKLGHDSRYYTMVRGWLVQQLQNDRSIHDAQGNQTSSNIQQRISFLQKAIRAIDLE